MKYAEQLERVQQLTQALLYILDIMERRPVDYPDAMRAYNSVALGIIPRVSTVCPHCQKDIVITTGIPVGGLDDALACLQEAIINLEMEVEFDGEGETQINQESN
jgi:hypothetical protein